MNSSLLKPTEPVSRRLAFTLIEVLIATVMTLLIMAALAQGFKQISDGISQGRARLNLNERLRSVNNLIREDLRRITVPLTPPLAFDAGNGYFEYYEGPMFDGQVAKNATLVNGNATEGVLNSRYGDADDYMAFTVQAPAGNWYRGKVPLALLKAKENFEAIEAGIAPPWTLVLTDWTTDVVIESEFAEVVYFAQPGRNADGTIRIGPNANFTLHRRVLLIRPDLNFFSDHDGDPATEDVAHLFVDTSGTVAVTAQIVANPAAVPFDPTFANPTPPPVYLPPYEDAAREILAMSDAFQRCDLSMRSTNIVVPGGTVQRYVAANTLEDLTLRENRFAHWVRSVTPPVFGTTLPNSTTMPLIALGETLPQFARGYLLPPRVGGAGFRFIETVGAPRHSGFLVPEYVLAGDRFGEDILLNACLGFDVKVFDPEVSLFYHPGLNGLYDGTDDYVLGPSDPGYELTLANYPTQLGSIASTGDFVDLCWANQMTSPDATRQGTISSNALIHGIMATPFSGVEIAPSGVANIAQMSGGLLQSGQVLYQPGRNPRSDRLELYQPTLDTSTEFYNGDGRHQHDRNWDKSITMYDPSGAVSFTGMRDHIMAGAGDDILLSPATTLDASLNGLDDNLDSRVDDENEQEILAPFRHRVQAIQISLRVEDVTANQVQQVDIRHGVTE